MSELADLAAVVRAAVYSQQPHPEVLFAQKVARLAAKTSLQRKGLGAFKRHA